MSDVQLGELLCDSMTEAENATLLSFPISADEVGDGVVSIYFNGLSN